MSETNPDEKIVGIFSISSIDQKRIFVNFLDFFPDQPFPKYIRDCTSEDFRPNVANIREQLQNAEPDELEQLIIRIQESLTREISDLVRGESFRFHAETGLSLNEIRIRDPIPIMVPNACGDCTIFGSNVRPDFWED